MGEHDTWYDLLYHLPAWENLSAYMRDGLGRGWKFMMFQNSHWTITHIMGALVVLLIVIIGALKYRSARNELTPARKFGLRAMFEVIMDATFSIMEGVMGEKSAKKYFPLIGSLALFILFSNLMALVPGMGTPSDTLKNNVAIAGVVFLMTHVWGVKENGLAYFKHFLGPVKPLYPLMLIIELISHIARPVSLSLRLMGNMASDHKVVFAFFALVPFLVPVPFLILGILVSVVQTLVFCLLSTIYIAQAVAHEH